MMQGEKRQQVAGVERARIDRRCRDGTLSGPEDGDAVLGRHGLARLAALDVAALLDREVDDDRARPQIGHHVAW